MKEKVIFFGNGPLAEYALAVIASECQVIFHARTREDLEEVKRLKREVPEAHGVLASFGVMIKPDVLELFEPEGILNIHPSLLPEYRGASPIESAILDGKHRFGVSIMKLVEKMDAGPIYWQIDLGILSEVLCFYEELLSSLRYDAVTEMLMNKDVIYLVLAQMGASWICGRLDDLPEPEPQENSRATYCGKLKKSDGLLTPETDTAEMTLRKIVAYQGFPKPKFAFWGKNCIILEAHTCEVGETAVLAIPCADGGTVAVDRLQPEGRRAMDAKSFVNGYKRDKQ